MAIEVGSDYRSPRPWHRNAPELSLGLAISAAFAPSPAPGATATLEVSLSSLLSLGMEIAFIGSATAGDPTGGSITVDRQMGALFAALSVIAPRSEDSPAVALLAGVTLLHYSARAQGYPQSETPAGFEPGLILGARGTLPIFDRFFVYGEVDANAVANTLHFQIAEGSGTSTTLITQPVFWPSLALGVGAHFL